MGRAVAVCLVGLVASVAGCQKPAAPANDWSQTTLFGMYEFEVERPPGGPLNLTARRTDDGAGHVDELVDYQIGPRRLRVVNGDLALDDTRRGRVQKGDKIRLTADGRLSVNATERAAE
ncbi:MAG: hypothetical protein C0501_07205 [Isosphaera sp.]|nr:hypothetical protein [Isosphaera sp.]